MKRLLTGVGAFIAAAALAVVLSAQTFPGFPGSGRIQIGQATGPALWKTLSGDCTITAAGVITCPASSATAGAATFRGNPTATAGAALQDFTIQGLSATAGPNANLHFLVMYDHVGGPFKKVTPGQIAGAATAGVSSLGGQTGAIAVD